MVDQMIATHDGQPRTKRISVGRRGMPIVAQGAVGDGDRAERIQHNRVNGIFNRRLIQVTTAAIRVGDA